VAGDVEIPLYRKDAPLGTSVFLTDSQYMDCLKRKEAIENQFAVHMKDHLENDGDRSEDSFLKPLGKSPGKNYINIGQSVIHEPIPAKQFCEACCDTFKCYYTHISTLQH
jgi:hypothetical protein